MQCVLYRRFGTVHSSSLQELISLGLAEPKALSITTNISYVHIPEGGLGDTQRQAGELISYPVWVPRLGFCPLTGHIPGLSLTFSLDPIP